MIFLPFFTLIFGFFTLLKLVFSSVRFSDTNIYFYTAGKLLQGGLLYKDLFFTNFPLFPYVSSMYRVLINGNIESYYKTSIGEALITAVLLFYILHNQTKNRRISFLGSALYLFSFITLVTSDYQTGIYTASIFLTSAYFLWVKKKPFWTGIFLGLSIMVKAYCLPIVVAFVVYSFLQNKSKAVGILLGVIISSFVVLIPSIIFARAGFIKDVFMYSLFRLPGLNKSTIIWFFVQHDISLFLLLVLGAVQIRKNTLLGLILVFSTLFFLAYQDTYYLYLEVFVPFIILVLPQAFYLASSIHKKGAVVLYGFFGIIVFFNLYVYLSGFTRLNTIRNVDYIVKTIQKAKPRYLYGGMETTSLFSEKSNIPLLPGVSDTNTNIFRKHFLNAKQLTQKAVMSKTLIIAKGGTYADTQDLLLDEVYEAHMVRKSCHVITQTEVITESPEINTISVWKCY